MKADFSGYATKAGLLCSDGRTIMPDAFKHQDQAQVPLVYMHGHTDIENVLGHAILENRPDGVYTYCFFNDTPKAQHAKAAVEHRDITMMSIWANKLMERGKQVFHGAIREVSLVLSGANPGALIETVTIRHSDGDVEVAEDEAIIFTGLELEHEDKTVSDKKEDTVQQLIDGMSDEQKSVLMQKVGEALAHATTDTTSADDETAQDIYDSMTDKQKEVLHFMIGEALEEADSVKQDNIDTEDTGTAGDTDKTANLGDTDTKGTNQMKHNVFEQTGDSKSDAYVLSHDDMKGIISSAIKRGSFKDAVDDYALAHGITNIDQLFPDATALTNTPDWTSRRMEWVAQLLGGVRKTPFSRIKTAQADITMDEARAKGYVKGALKKEEFFSLSRRTTTPTTIYKKQALDRDDIIDITDFDVVAWLKTEMRIMLDEELARAILVGDGRDVSSEDKINEGNIRPIATDNELYTTTVTVNVSDANSSMMEVADAFLTSRADLKGSGTPTFYTTEYWIARFLMTNATDGRRMWPTVTDLATQLRVTSIVAVEVLQETPDIVGILVNPTDYVLGADRGGAVSMFDDFDIDYNKQKYLIETRVSGALTKLKSAIVIRSTAGTNVLVAPAAPAFNATTGALTITNQTGVVYKHGATTINAAGSPYTVPDGQTWVVDATPAAGYYFASSDDDQWSFTNPA